ncbi:MAG: mechanosensitive ion channel domain-containing protein [Planctomycetota bacterium]|nr:mechanosensitive ion channel domain-containing protein [Planctomycetota bacterium]
MRPSTMLDRINAAGLPLAFAALIAVLATTGTVSAVPPMPATTTAEEPETGARPPAPPKWLSSPEGMVQGFLKAMPTEGKREIEVAVQCFTPGVLPSTNAVRDASLEQLAKILTWLGFRDETMLAMIPDQGPKSAPDTVVLLPWTGAPNATGAARAAILRGKLGNERRIELEQDATGAWTFAPAAVSSDFLDAAREAIRSIQIANGEVMTDPRSIDDWVATLESPWLTRKVVFVEIWQWMGLGVIILAGLVVDLLLRIVGGRAVRPLMRRLHEDVEDLTMRRAVRGLGLAGSTLTWFLLLPLLELPLVAFGILQPAAKFAFVLALFVFGWRATDLVAEFMLGRARRSVTKADDILVPMIRKTLKVLLVVFTLLNLSPLLGLNLGPLLAAIGVGSFGFAFAFKNSLENLFGSVTVILDRPFQVGDWVVVEGVEGTVETVGLRSTRIRTFYNSLVSVPNANLITCKVDNYGLRKYRRWKTNVGIQYGTPIPRIEAFCEAIRELIRVHPYTRKDYYQVWVNEFGPSSIDILVYVFWEAPDWQTELRERHRFMIDIMRMADELGVDFAFPSRTLYLQRAAEAATPEDPTLDGLSDPQTAMRSGRVAVRKVTADAKWRKEEPPKYRFLDADETARIDAIDDRARAAEVEQRLENRERSDGPPEAGQDPDNPDFTEQRDAGG